MYEDARAARERLAFEKGFALGSLKTIRNMLENGATRESISRYIAASLLIVGGEP